MIDLHLRSSSVVRRALRFFLVGALVYAAAFGMLLLLPPDSHVSRASLALAAGIIQVGGSALLLHGRPGKFTASEEFGGLIGVAVTVVVLQPLLFSVV